MVIIQTLLSSFFIWCIIIAFLGMLQGEKKSAGSSEKNTASNDKAENFSRFAVVICAHDEENVIGNLLENLQSQNYPAEKFHVFVLADHCKDGTVKKAKAFANVTVWQRTGGERSGKGAVLN